MFIFSSYKTVKIGVNSTKCRKNLVVVKLFFRDISTCKNGNDPLTTFLLVNFIL